MCGLTALRTAWKIELPYLAELEAGPDQPKRQEERPGPGEVTLARGRRELDLEVAEAHRWVVLGYEALDALLDEEHLERSRQARRYSNRQRACTSFDSASRHVQPPIGTK